MIPKIKIQDNMVSKDLMRKYYNYDPRKLYARFDSVCSCGKLITKGDEIVYFPKSRKAECITCGSKALESIQDEDFFTNNSL